MSSTSVKWCPDPDLNQGHEDFQSSALPTELSGLNMFNLAAIAASLRRGVLNCFSFTPSTVFTKFFIKKCLFAVFYSKYVLVALFINDNEL